MRRRALLGVGWLSVILLVTLAVIAPAGAIATQPPGGNNGTVKVHAGATETEPTVRNEPHVCTFHLHFFFADPAQAGAWHIDAWAPGDKGATVLSGTYDTHPTGEDRQPAATAYALADGHYKLFWQGRNEHNLEHKTFWVECPSVSPSPSGSVEPSASASPSGSVEPSASASPSGSVEPSASASPGASASPTGGVEPTTETSPTGSVLPATSTLPPTDAIAASEVGTTSGRSLLLLGLAGLIAAMLVLLPRTASRR